MVAQASRWLCGDLERARDAVQEVFLRLCRQGHTRGVDRAWLLLATRRICIDVLRKESRVQRLKEEAGWQVPSPGLNPDPGAEAPPEQERLERALQQLPEKHREVLRLKFQADLSYAEMAEVLGTTESTVGWWLHAGVKALREKFAHAAESKAGAPVVPNEGGAQ